VVVFAEGEAVGWVVVGGFGERNQVGGVDERDVLVFRAHHPDVEVVEPFNGLVEGMHHGPGGVACTDAFLIDDLPANGEGKVGTGGQFSVSSFEERKKTEDLKPENTRRGKEEGVE
jgi:hypothetical protein